MATAVTLDLVVAVAAVVLFRRVRGTTLAAPALWALAAALALLATDLYLATRPATPALWASLLRYLAAVGTFSPLMAVLGAKRPQDRGWQWIVASLWLVLLVPAGQALVAPSGERLELFAAWKLLLWALVALGLLNYLPTRLAPAAVLFAAGQVLILSPQLFDVASAGHRHLAGMALIALCVVAATLIARATRRGSTERRGADAPPLPRLSERWCALRDGWGAFWALRIQQRIAQAAELGAWPVRLQWWSGFEPADARLEPHVIAQIEQSLDALLRRFERLD
ncbi:MAG: hypothetical protein DCC67_18050 [Planctomycetota bacterium]|nr:MAG: hypothetical protein DCC67_18050 [Planctomycetota bacterium]